MKITRAQHFGMCFGVRDAIHLARSKAAEGSLTLLGDLVHNPSIMDSLKRSGIEVASNPESIPPSHTVMITAHGASNRKIEQTKALGLNVLEGTCPLVRSAHQALQSLVQDGCYPVVIGKKGHVEVLGLTEDFPEVSIILDSRDILDLPLRPLYGVVSQTTQPLDRVLRLVNEIRKHFPESEVRFTDTVCHPTKQRQKSAQDLAKASDVVVVIGGNNSNNTAQLVSTCKHHCSRVHHVQTPDDLCPEWFGEEDRVGITAGTSTPDYLVDAVEKRIREFAATASEETDWIPAQADSSQTLIASQTHS